MREHDVDVIELKTFQGCLQTFDNASKHIVRNGTCFDQNRVTYCFRDRPISFGPPR